MGTWKGKSYLPGSDEAQYFSLTLRVVAIKDNKFEGYLSTMEPYDTTIRYDARFTGEFFGDYVTIKSTKVFYVRNSPGSRWLLSCVNCKPPKMTFGLQDNKFYIRGTIDECYPQCKGVSEFTRDIDQFTDKDQDSLYALLKLERPRKTEIITAAVVTPELKPATPEPKPAEETQRTIFTAVNTDITKNERPKKQLTPLVVNNKINRQTSLTVNATIPKKIVPEEVAKTVVAPDTQSVVINTKPVVSKPVVPDSFSALPKGYSERKVNVIRTIPVDTDSITIRVYDNGVVDGDVVSVVYNDKVVIDQLSLISKAFVIKIPVKASGNNTLVFHAHNLGEFPPNTAKLEILYGAKKEELTISSDYTVSSSINIVFDKKF